MHIFLYELKKIVQAPVFLGLLAIFLALNFHQIHTYSGYQHDINQINDIAGETGVKIDDSFLSKFQTIYQSETKELPDLYKNKTGKTSADVPAILNDFDKIQGLYNLSDSEKRYFEDAACINNLNTFIQSRESAYQNLDIHEIGNDYIKSQRISGRAADFIRLNYEKLQERVTQIKATNEQETLFFPGLVYHMQNFLFGDLFNTMILESGLLGILIMLFSVNYEFTHKSESLVYTSRRGRTLVFNKLGASILAGSIIFAIIVSVTLTVFFLNYHYSNVWNATITSALNTDHHGMLLYPYITWKSMTIWQYLWASIGFAFLLQVLFCLLSFVLAVFCRNNYLGFLIYLLTGMAVSILPGIMPWNNMMPIVLSANPIQMWLTSGSWMMESGTASSYPHYELIVLAAWGILAILLGFVGIRTFKRKNL